MIVVSEQNFTEVVEKLSAIQLLAADTETTGLRWAHKAHLFSVIIADDLHEYYFNFNHWNPNDQVEKIVPLPFEWVKKLTPIFQGKSRRIIMANAKFDLHMLLNEGITVETEVWDVLVMARVEDNSHFKYSLDAVGERSLGVNKLNIVEEWIAKNKNFTWERIPGKRGRKKNKHFHLVPFGVIAPYGCQDARMTYDVYLEQVKTFVKWDKTRDLRVDSIYNIIENEMKLTKTCLEIERTGMQLNVGYVQDKLAIELKKMEESKALFLQMTGMELIDSAKVLKVALAGKVEAGVTAKGGVSYTEAVIEKSKHPVAGVLLQFRDANKRASSYYSNFLYHADDAGIIHCNIRQGGTKTGRFSIADPALQTLQAVKEDDDMTPEAIERTKEVRRSFMPRSGYFYLGIDYKGFEFRAMLDTAGETELAEAIDKGLDPHQVTADLVGITRKQAKVINFGLLYGMGIRKLAVSLGVSLDEARRIRDKYFARLTKVAAFIKDATAQGKYKKYVISRFSRRYFCPDPNFAYKMPNVLIQGGTADAIKFAMVTIDLYLRSHDLRSRMVLQIHDELLFEIAYGEEWIIPHVKKIMIDAWPSKFHKMDVDCEWSDQSWGEMKAYA